MLFRFYFVLVIYGFIVILEILFFKSLIIERNWFYLSRVLGILEYMFVVCLEFLI